MARANDPLLAHARDLLETLGRISTRAMFGGHGVDCDGVFFALIADDRLHLKVDAQTREAFAAAGCRPFICEGRAGPSR